MGPHCVLRSVLRQDTITLTTKRLTLNGAPLHAEVSAAAGTTTGFVEFLWRPVLLSATRPSMVPEG